jgi:hypothetical protein
VRKPLRKCAIPELGATMKKSEGDQIGKLTHCEEIAFGELFSQWLCFAIN